MPDNDFFLVFGGYCEEENRILIIKQSIFRHMHPFTWIVSITFILLGIYSYLTGWIYTSGPALGWKGFLFFGLGILCLRAVRHLFDRIKGFTNDGKVPLGSIIDICVMEERRVWYFKERKIVPAFIVRYKKNGKLMKRRIRLNVRYYQEEFEQGIKFFKRLGFYVES